MTPTTVKDILREARALIEIPEYWAQGTHWNIINGVTSHCASYAIIKASECDTDARAAAFHLHKTIKSHTGVKYLGVTFWNDDPERTHAEVMQAFDWALADDPR